MEKQKNIYIKVNQQEIVIPKDDKITELQRKIGVTFHDASLLSRALMHSSYSNEQHTGHLGSNERLEFLGDAVLELVSSEFFFFRNPELPEGQLTKLRSSFVCEPALAYCAEQIPLGEYLLLGKGEDKTGGRLRPSVVSDAMEAVIGAIYLDSGFAAAKDFILRFILNDIEGKQYFYDAKTILQEELQKNGDIHLNYEIVEDEGPDHNKSFTAAVIFNGEELSRGSGSSKKQAEQHAAYAALKKRGVI